MEFHEPAKPSGEGIVLTHGAGGNSKAPLLITIAEALSAAGMLVGRFDMPFRRKKPSGPPFPAGAAADREGIREAVEAMRQRVTGPVYMGGHSYGGRQASMLAAEQPGCAAALLLISYPLHPPGKPLQLRTAHFPALRTPALFVHGAKDEFATEEEMAAAIVMIPARTARLTIPAAGHDLKRGKFDLTAMVAEFKRLTA